MNLKARRSSLTEQVGQLLQQYIRSNNLQPGDELPTEMELASLFGVSRTVIREGLSAVAAIGIIETESGRRARIASLSGEVLNSFFANAVRLNAKSIIEILKIREALETYAVQLAATSMDTALLEKLHAQLNAMEATLAKGDYERFVELDIEFHSCLAEMSGNSMLFHLVKGLRSATRESISSGLRARRSADSLLAVWEVHQEIFAAVQARDSERASKAMRQHFDVAIAAVEENQLLTSESRQSLQ